MADRGRPLSPHMQVYSWAPHMVLSIVHRTTGLALGAGTLLLAWWLLAAVAGPEAYEQFQTCLGSWLGRLVLFGFTWALMQHFCSGIRHLIWDTGRGLDIKSVAVTNHFVIWGAIILTIAAWVLGYAMMGDL